MNKWNFVCLQKFKIAKTYQYIIFVLDIGLIFIKLHLFCFNYVKQAGKFIIRIVCNLGMNAEEQQKMGERVAYYQQAAERLADARKLAKYIEPIQITQEALTFTNDVVEGKKKAAKNENEFIYHEEVPDKDLLMDLKPVCLVKAIPINLNDPEVSTFSFIRSLMR